MREQTLKQANGRSLLPQTARVGVPALCARRLGVPRGAGAAGQALYCAPIRALGADVADAGTQFSCFAKVLLVQKYKDSRR